MSGEKRYKRKDGGDTLVAAGPYNSTAITRMTALLCYIMLW